MTTDTTTATNYNIAIPDNKPLRFTAGKLIMLSPKHKNNLGNVQCKMYNIIPEPAVESRATARTGHYLSFSYFPFDTDKKYPVGSTQHSGPSLVGKPILLVEDPHLVDAKGVPTYVMYSRKSEPCWVMKVLFEEKLFLFVCSKKTWKHYLAIIKPERAEKYGL